MFTTQINKKVSCFLFNTFVHDTNVLKWTLKCSTQQKSIQLLLIWTPFSTSVCLKIHTRKSVELGMAVETIYTTIEKITLKKEGSLLVCTGTRIPENSSMDRSGSGSVGTNPCNDCRAGYQSTTQSSGRAQATSRPKQKSSKRPVTDKGQPSKRPKK